MIMEPHHHLSLLRASRHRRSIGQFERSGGGSELSSTGGQNSPNVRGAQLAGRG